MDHKKEKKRLYRQRSELATASKALNEARGVEWVLNTSIGKKQVRRLTPLRAKEGGTSKWHPKGVLVNSERERT